MALKERKKGNLKKVPI